MKRSQKYVGLALALPLAGLAAFSALADTTAAGKDMVTVEVKKVPGGAVEIGYMEVNEDGEERQKNLPLGETVELPVGTELSFMGRPGVISWYSSGLDSYVNSQMNQLTVTEADGDITVFEYEVLGYDYGENLDVNPYEGFSWVLEENTIFTPEFEAYTTGEGSWPEFWPDNNPGNYRLEVEGGNTHYFDSVTAVELDIETFVDDGLVESINLIEDLDLRFMPKEWDARWYAFTDPGEVYEMSEAFFEITSTGIRSRGELPVGVYPLSLSYYANNSEEEDENGERARLELDITIAVGKHYKFNTRLAYYEYRDEEGKLVREDLAWRGIPARNPEMEECDYKLGTAGFQYFDGSVTVGNALRTLEESGRINRGFDIIGHERTGRYVDIDGNEISVEDTAKLKDAVDGYTYIFYHMLDDNGKAYEIPKVELIRDEDVRKNYSDTWVERNGKWYYYHEDGTMATSEWFEVDIDGFLITAFCGPDGAMVRNGIGGTVFQDEDGNDVNDLWLFDENGMIDFDFSGEKTIGMFQYMIHDGHVGEIELIATATSSNAGRVDQNLNTLLNASIELDDEQKMIVADNISVAYTNEAKAGQENITDALVAAVDQLLVDMYGNNAADELQISEDFDSEAEDVLVLDDGAMRNVTGLLAAAGYTSENLENEDEVSLTVTQEPVRASRSKNKEVLRLDMELKLGEETVELQSPVLFEIQLPDNFFELYPTGYYTYTAKHIGESGTETFKPEIDKETGIWELRAESFSKYTLVVTEKEFDFPEATAEDDIVIDNNTSNDTADEGITIVEAPKPTVVVDVKKGQVNVETGIITGTGDGYSEWIAVTSEDGTTTWKFEYADGTMAVGTIETRADGTTYEQPVWEQINGRWFAFGADGNAVSSWIRDEKLGGWFFIDINAGMLTGWQQINGVWYYLNPVSDGWKGICMLNTWIDGWYVDATGAWDGKEQVPVQ